MADAQNAQNGRNGGKRAVGRGTRARASSALVATLIVLALGIAGVLAYEAHDASRSHRETAERALRDYAAVAAWELVAGLGEALDGIVQPSLAPATTGRASSPFEPLLDPAALADRAPVAPPCAEGSATTYMVVDLRSGSVNTAGAPLSPTTVQRLRDALTADVRAHYRLERGTVLLDVADAPLLAYGVRAAEHGAPLAGYGLTLCRGTLGRTLVTSALTRRPLLPGDVSGGLPNDSLLTIVATTTGGDAIYQSPRMEASPFTAVATADRVGGIIVRVSLRPSALPRLRLGPPPRSRLPLLVTLLAAASGLFVIALMQLRREQELIRLRADFVSGVSHELRTPLTQILLFAETLRLGRARSDRERTDAADIIVQEARRLMQLVDNVLHFARAERGVPGPRVGPVALEPVVRETATLFAPLAEAAGATLALDLAPGIHAVTDASAVRQIVLNLLDNALKHGPAGQRVRVTLDDIGDRARLTVEDQGYGVRPQDRQRVWLPFVRATSSNAMVEGSGIGLAVVRELALSFGGAVEVDDAPGGGARFVVLLPLAGADAITVTRR
jgi:signal transduction histidine kinase